METKIYHAEIRLNPSTNRYTAYIVIINNEGTTLINKGQYVTSFGYINIAELVKVEDVKSYKFLISVEL